MRISVISKIWFLWNSALCIMLCGLHLERNLVKIYNNQTSWLPDVCLQVIAATGVWWKPRARLQLVVKLYGFIERVQSYGFRDLIWSIALVHAGWYVRWFQELFSSWIKSITSKHVISRSKSYFTFSEVRKVLSTICLIRNADFCPWSTSTSNLTGGNSQRDFCLNSAFTMIIVIIIVIYHDHHYHHHHNESHHHARLGIASTFQSQRRRH